MPIGLAKGREGTEMKLNEDALNAAWNVFEPYNDMAAAITAYLAALPKEEKMGSEADWLSPEMTAQAQEIASLRRQLAEKDAEICRLLDLAGQAMKERERLVDQKQNLTYDSVEQLAEELWIGRQVTYARLRDGTIPSIRLGKLFVIPRAAIAEWLKTAGGKLS
jgi:excisionase family DNA binding protein